MCQSNFRSFVLHWKMSLSSFHWKGCKCNQAFVSKWTLTLFIEFLFSSEMWKNLINQARNTVLKIFKLRIQKFKVHISWVLHILTELKAFVKGLKQIQRDSQTTVTCTLPDDENEFARVYRKTSEEELD